ncbi:MAG: FHA domain-containing protein [Solirubrobacteraceae bacterium]|nr:FHA domain-containing protein [Patulibacter sp.]
MDVVQLTTHIDATAVRVAINEDSFTTRESRDPIADQVRAETSRAAVLVVFDGHDHFVHDLTEGSHRIGRSITADIQLEDPMVSRKHAMIEREGSHIRVLDDRSLNGVRVNGISVDLQQTLVDGDEVQIGDFVLRLLVTD